MGASWELLGAILALCWATFGRELKNLTPAATESPHRLPALLREASPLEKFERSLDVPCHCAPRLLSLPCLEQGSLCSVGLGVGFCLRMFTFDSALLGPVAMVASTMLSRQAPGLASQQVFAAVNSSPGHRPKGSSDAPSRHPAPRPRPNRKFSLGPVRRTANGSFDNQFLVFGLYPPPSP